MGVALRGGFLLWFNRFCFNFLFIFTPADFGFKIVAAKGQGKTILKKLFKKKKKTVLQVFLTWKEGTLFGFGFGAKIFPWKTIDLLSFFLLGLSRFQKRAKVAFRLLEIWFFAKTKKAWLIFFSPLFSFKLDFMKLSGQGVWGAYKEKAGKLCRGWPDEFLNFLKNVCKIRGGLPIFKKKQAKKRRILLKKPRVPFSSKKKTLLCPKEMKKDNWGPWGALFFLLILIFIHWGARARTSKFLGFFFFTFWANFLKKKKNFFLGETPTFQKVGKPHPKIFPFFLFGFFLKNPMS